VLQFEISMIPSFGTGATDVDKPNSLRVVEQRLALAVRGLRINDSLEPEIPIRVNGARDVQGTDEQDSEDHEGEDPLQGDDLDGELFDSQG
jgi:hypothetical protein